MGKWYNKKVSEVLSEIGSDFRGLSQKEADSRLEKYGYNEFSRKETVTLKEVLFRQFTSSLVILLFIAAVVSIYMGEYTEAGVIFVVLAVNAAIGTYHEYSAERSLEALKKIQAQEVTVLRDGDDKVLDAREVVPGDIILLRAGDKVPADGRVIECAVLSMDESTLTGESTPVRKTNDSLKGSKVLAERSNMAFAGTHVSSGRGVMVVLATDDKTELGKVYRGITKERELFPLQIKVNRFSSNLGKAAFLILAAFTLFFGIVLGKEYGYDVGHTLELGIAQAVSFIPEGLPIVVTIALAVGVSEMAKKRALSRKLQAIETIGGIDIACVDKTGTLTINQMKVSALYVGGKQYKAAGGTKLYGKGGKFEGIDVRGLMKLLETGILCNDGIYDKKTGKKAGDPLETAIIEYASNFALERSRYLLVHPRAAEIPFDPKNKYMVTANKDGKEKGYTFHLKGSPEAVAEMCTRINGDKGTRRITKKDRKEIIKATEKLASTGLRVLAFAQKPAQKKVDDLDRDYVFLGLMGFHDPLRPNVPQAISKAKEAGIKVIMITGDHKLTAENIAKQAGIIENKSHLTVTGKELESMKEKELAKIVHDIRVFARVTSEHKSDIVKLLKSSGYVVAMTGDGVNDAIALKGAHVGVALGSGTEVAKEASDIVITDDNFETIIEAVEDGRHSAANVRKVIKYLFATNVIEVIFLFAVLLSPFWSGSLLPLALLPIHILFVNLVTDGVCDVTLAMEKKDRHLMKQKPKEFSGSLFPPEVVKYMLLTAAIVLPCLFATYLHYVGNPEITEDHMRTAVFTLLVFFQFWAAFNARAVMESIFSIGFFSNRFLTLAISASVLIQLLVIYTPEMNHFMKTAPLGIWDWAWIIPVSSLLFISFEVLKFLQRRGYPLLT